MRDESQARIRFVLDRLTLAGSKFDAYELGWDDALAAHAAADEVLRAARVLVEQFEALKAYQHQHLVVGQTLESATRHWETMWEGAPSLDFAPLSAALGRSSPPRTTATTEDKNEDDSARGGTTGAQ